MSSTRSLVWGLVSALAMALAGLPAEAAAPSAGSELQLLPPAPQPPAKPLPTLRIAPATAPAVPAPSTLRVTLHSLQLSGQRVYSEAELRAVSGFEPGREVGLADMNSMASRITDFYRNSGYFLAQAYLPAQDIADGSLTIAVLEGQYGAITLRPDASLPAATLAVAHRLLGGLEPGSTVAIAPLERRLLLLSDLPGLDLRSTLAPGASVGASDLIVDLAPGPRLAGSVDADNAGSRYSGANRLGASLSVNRPLGWGDVATLRALGAGPGMQYARASWQAQPGEFKAGLAYSAMRYRLAQEFESLQADGSARIASVYASHPLLRSRSANLNLLLNLDSKRLHDNVASTEVVTDKKASVAMLSLTGDLRDALGGSGASSGSFTWSSGRVDILSPDALAADAAAADSSGHFDKLAISLSRQQSLGQALTLVAAFNGQWAAKNLDSSEKMSLGGAGGVRAYPSGEASGDSGWLLTLEARTALPLPAWGDLGQLQLAGFVDSGQVRLNQRPWAPGANRKALSGAGLGLSWSDNRGWMLKAQVAHKLGPAAATSAPDASTRFWLQGVSYF